MIDKKRIVRKGFRAPEGDWRRVDLHLHTPASADWQEPGVTYLEWLQKAESRGLDIVAITDHNTVEGVAKLRAEIERLTWLEANERLRPQERRDLDEYRRLGDKILVLPGFEFTATFGFHIIGIFPPETPLRTLELLLLRLSVPVDKLAEGSTELGATSDVLNAYRLINEAGGIVIAAHANSTHGVALHGMSFGGQTKIAFTQDRHLHALEVTDLDSVSRRATIRFFDGSKPEYPRRMHCIQGSDAHRLVRDPNDKNRPGIGDRVTEILLPEVSFDALKAVFEGDDFTLTRPYQPMAETPFDHVEAARAQGNTIVQAFHESAAREAGRLHKVLSDAVAFANTNGGTIYIGVGPVQRKGVARGVENPEAGVSMLRRELERNIVPHLDARVDTVPSLGATIIRVTVPSGPEKPYALNQTQIFVRQESETNEAMRDEIVRLVLAGRQAAALAEVEQTLGPVSTEKLAQIAAAVNQPEVPELSAAPSAGEVGATQLPSVGVEIVGIEERQGSRYFTIRDLRNGSTVQNVTPASARKLWSYAITQHLTQPVDAALVEWRGEYGLVKAERRAKKLRYDLALRHPDAPGGLRVFYGVTEDGMTGPWARFLSAEPQRVVVVEVEDDEAEGEFEIGMAASAEGGLPAEAPGKAKPRPRRRRSRTGKGEGRAEVETEAEAAAQEPTVGVKAEAEPQVQTPAVEAAPTAEAKPKSSARPSRQRKPKVQDQVEAKPQPAAEPVVESTGRAAGPSHTADSVNAPAAAKPKSRSRRQTPKAEAPAPGIPAEVAPVEAAAEAKPKPRSRSRKPAAKVEPEV